jgi:hypothetical protein
MLTKPAKLLPIHFNLGSPLATDADGRYYRYTASLLMDNPFDHSDINYNNVYTLDNLNVGDYVATDGAGRIMKIVAISAQDPTTASITVEDEFRLNQQQDGTGNSMPYIESNRGIVFEVVEGRPILFPYSDKSTSVVGFIKDYADEIQSRFDYLRQDTLVSVEQSHDFAVGDLITYKLGSYALLDVDDVFLGTVVEIANPITDSFRFRPNGSVVDIAITGTGPFFYWDPTEPGKLTNVLPATDQRRITAFFKLSSTQAIYFGGASVLNNVSGYVTLDTDQTITSEKTFDAPQHFLQDVDITSTTAATDSITGALTVAGGAGIAGSLYIGQNLNVTGNLSVSGTTTVIDTTNLTVKDKLIELATGTTGNPLGDSGIVIERGTSNNVFIGWDESEDVVTFATGTFTGSSTGDLTLTDASIRANNVDATGTLDVAGQATLATLKITDIASGNIPYASTDGQLVDSTNLKFDGTDLTVSSAVVSDLTVNRIVIAGISGALRDDANLTFNGSKLYVGGNIQVTGNTELGTTSSNTLTINSRIASSLIPSATNNISLGSDTVNWNEAWLKDLHVSGTASISGPIAFTTGKIVVSNSDNTAIDHTMYVMYATTTDATPTELFLNSSGTRITMVNNSTMMFEADVVGRDSTGAKHTAIRLQGVIDRTANSTVLVGYVNQTIIADTGESWVATATADNVTDTLVITVTGDSSTIRWTAFVKTTRITH